MENHCLRLVWDKDPPRPARPPARPLNAPGHNGSGAEPGLRHRGGPGTAADCPASNGEPRLASSVYPISPGKRGRAVLGTLRLGLRAGAWGGGHTALWGAGLSLRACLSLHTHTHTRSHARCGPAAQQVPGITGEWRARSGRGLPGDAGCLVRVWLLGGRASCE